MKSTDDLGIYVPHYRDQGLPPHTTWMTEGLPCALYVNGFGGLNGYVRLPETHPDRIMAATAIDFGRQSFVWPDGRHEFTTGVGYDHISVLVHGGWTFGPDDYGWIGFDTNHGFDKWPRETSEELILNCGHNKTIFQYFETRDMLNKYLHNPYVSAKYNKNWTVQRVIDETEQAAVQLALKAKACLIAARLDQIT